MAAAAPPPQRVLQLAAYAGGVAPPLEHNGKENYPGAELLAVMRECFALLTNALDLLVRLEEPARFNALPPERQEHISGLRQKLELAGETVAGMRAALWELGPLVQPYATHGVGAGAFNVFHADLSSTDGKAHLDNFRDVVRLFAAATWLLTQLSYSFAKRIYVGWLADYNYFAEGAGRRRFVRVTTMILGTCKQTEESPDPNMPVFRDRDEYRAQMQRLGGGGGPAGYVPIAVTPSTYLTYPGWDVISAGDDLPLGMEFDGSIIAPTACWYHSGSETIIWGPPTADDQARALIDMQRRRNGAAAAAAGAGAAGGGGGDGGGGGGAAAPDIVAVNAFEALTALRIERAHLARVFGGGVFSWQLFPPGAVEATVQLASAGALYQLADADPERYQALINVRAVRDDALDLFMLERFGVGACVSVVVDYDSEDARLAAIQSLPSREDFVGAGAKAALARMDAANPSMAILSALDGFARPLSLEPGVDAGGGIMIPRLRSNNALRVIWPGQVPTGAMHSPPTASLAFHSRFIDLADADASTRHFAVRTATGYFLMAHRERSTVNQNICARHALVSAILGNSYKHVLSYHRGGAKFGNYGQEVD